MDETILPIKFYQILSCGIYILNRGFNNFILFKGDYKL